MKKMLALCLCVLLPLLLLCACSAEDDGEITVITKASVSHSLQTTTTTTPPTTVPTYGGPNTPSSSGQTGAPTTAATVATDGETTEVGNRIAQIALDHVGKPFENGASGPDSFDNPGFVAYCYKQAGFTVARRATAMASFGAEAPLTALQPGDLLVFCNEVGGSAEFVGIYIGGDQFVACNNPGSLTKVQKLDNKYWLPRLIAARRAS